MEPFTSNLYVRRVLSGEFIVINKHLLRDLQEVGIWSEDMRLKLIAARGSVQGIKEIPEEIRERYRTVWEIPQRHIVDMAADRGPYICQSMSLNIHMRDATSNKLTALHFHTWKRGLKTGMYYLRNTPAVEAVQFTVDKGGTVGKGKKKRGISSIVGGHAQEEKVITSIPPTSISQEDDESNMCISCDS